ncbi:hypothetical protein QO058_30470 (plasmid) [Bosea vestrisii]|uniref:hypothetical protein n=1 Tax=Bosea vestrisii TaxID=151416 RepID=UPI0024DFE7AB|nr:hypothetical protein [Bosea vestrisii]WID99719.1 hypothetical protein QO058_30470 [Bosea vestrisii]
MSIETDYDRATGLVHEIGAQIVKEQAAGDDTWDSLAVTAIVAGGSVQISGYAYEDGGRPRPARVGSGPLADRFEELCKAMQKPDGDSWKTTLVQIRRASGKLTIDYDYANPLRWKVTPANLATLPEEMRPI